MATEQRSTVIGVFRDRSLAAQAADELRQHGWDDVHILGRNSGGVLDALKNAFSDRDTSATTASELDQWDLPEDQRQFYQHELEAGNFILVAHPHGQPLETRDIFHRHGAYNVFVPFETGGERVVPVRREIAQVQKQLVDVGEIRIHKRVITEQRTFTVPVTREEVTIERLPRNNPSQPAPQFAPPPVAGQVQSNVAPPYAGNPPVGPVQSNVAPSPQYMDNPLSGPLQPNVPPAQYTTNPPVGSAQPYPAPGQPPAPFAAEDEVLREGGTLRILVREEQVIINKQPIVVEEILVRKQSLQETRHLVEPIRHEEVRIENVGNVTIHEQDADVTAPAPSVSERQQP